MNIGIFATFQFHLLFFSENPVIYNVAFFILEKTLIINEIWEMSSRNSPESKNSAFTLSIIGNRGH